MIPFNDAFEGMMAAVSPLQGETVPLDEALGRVLRQDIYSDVDMPPFNKAAMDGYALRREDLGLGELEILETVPAGAVPTKALRPGTCTRIFTGAPVPDGADCVIMQEQVERQGERIRILESGTSDNICLKGEESAAGGKLFSAGERITPAHVAVLAAAGVVSPLVGRCPRIAVFATGSELVDPLERPGPGRIRDSNRPQISAQLRTMGIRPVAAGMLADREAPMIEAVREAEEQADLLLISGGVADGDFDLVPSVMEKRGFSLVFRSVAVQPGKHTIFGMRNGKYCFGLPGNPVSTYVIFETMVKPFIYGLMGHHYRPMVVQAALAGPLLRKKTVRQAFYPVRFLSPSEVEPVPYLGSAHIHAISRMGGLAAVPVGSRGFQKGENIHVRLLSA